MNVRLSPSAVVGFHRPLLTSSTGCCWIPPTFVDFLHRLLLGSTDLRRLPPPVVVGFHRSSSTSSTGCCWVLPIFVDFLHRLLLGSTDLRRLPPPADVSLRRSSSPFFTDGCRWLPSTTADDCYRRRWVVASTPLNGWLFSVAEWLLLQRRGMAVVSTPRNDCRLNAEDWPLLQRRGWPLLNIRWGMTCDESSSTFHLLCIITLSPCSS